MIEFKDCDVIIGKTGILVQNASIATENSLQSNSIIGRSPSSLIPNNNLSSKISLSYLLDVEREPILNIIKNLKINSLNLEPIPLEIAGLKFSSYLQSFSINVQTNDIARASASFICYVSGSGFLGNKRKTVNYNRDTNTIVNGWSSLITSSGTFLNVPTYDLSYGFQANYSPVYTIGNLIPTQVILLNGAEDISFTRDNNIEISFSGEKVSKHIISPNTEESILLHGLRYDWNTNSPNPLAFDIRDSQINSREITIEENEFVKIKVGIRQVF